MEVVPFAYQYSRRLATAEKEPDRQSNGDILKKTSHSSFSYCVNTISRCLASLAATVDTLSMFDKRIHE